MRTRKCDLKQQGQSKWIEETIARKRNKHNFKRCKASEGVSVLEDTEL